MYAFWDTCNQFVSRPEQYMKRLHDAVVLLSLPSSVGVQTPMEGDITLATVTKRLRDTDEKDEVKAMELRNWLAENLELKTLALSEVLYMYVSSVGCQTDLVCDVDRSVFGRQELDIALSLFLNISPKRTNEQIISEYLYPQSSHLSLKQRKLVKKKRVLS
jgi:hypothetical protein